MRTATLFSPIDPAGEQEPLDTAPSAVTPTRALSWALQLPCLGRAQHYLSPPAVGHLPRNPSQMWL